MLRKKYILVELILAVAAIVVYSFSGSPDFKTLTLKSFNDYKESIIEVNQNLVKAEDIDKFDFFEPNEDMVFQADFEPQSKQQSFEMLMTDSTRIDSKLIGIAQIAFEGNTSRLLIFEEETNYLLPFKDKTNGKTTYGGGRYINIPKSDLSENKITIDFIKARNFYCAYSEQFVCPVPPAENYINFEIKAGEKIFKK